MSDPAGHRHVLPTLMSKDRYEPRDIGQEDKGAVDVPTSGALPFPQPGDDEEDADQRGAVAS